MDLDQIPLAWSKRFGLAVSPLFEHEEVPDPTSHHVFLDGGQGTFALSTAAEEVWREGHVADWAWSSDIAHHVTITPSKVAVVKWDRPRDPTVLSRESVDRNLDDFYQFLTADRLSSTRSVVYHLLSVFRRIRSLVAAAKISDQRSSEIFLLCLTRLIFENELSSPASSWGINSDVSDLYDTLDKDGLSATLAEAKQSEGSFGLLKLHPALAIRHAGGLLFQEAHFDLIRAPSLDFFGYIGAPDVEQVGRGGAHFTPPALARSLVEHALCQLRNIDARSELRVCDPACGSGVFLHEVLRALRRMNFSGKVVLVGRDISPIAISMAKFVLNCAVRDWKPKGGVELDFRSLDSLEPNAIPESDLIVMNPPFISWGAQNESQRKRLISVVGKSASSRGDLSMAFVNRAISSLANDGVLGTLFPASLLSQQAAENWRNNLTDAAELTLLGMIGDYGLFTPCTCSNRVCCSAQNGQ
jgi:adenine-specific DNA-methyltransferase